jgi:hypothetical protein
MVRDLILSVDLPEPGDLVWDWPLSSPESKLESGQLTLHFLLKANLRAGKEANRDPWFSDRSKAARRGIPELLRHQPVTNFRGA